MENHLITKAKTFDAKAIAAICEENLLQNKSDKTNPEEISAKGFLMGRLMEDDIKEMIDDAENYLVFTAKNHDEASGYLIACDIERVDEILRNQLLSTAKSAKNKVLYYRQIAKKIGSKNVGSKLVQAMISEAKIRGYEEIICIIVDEPFYNQASIEFHKKIGFKFIKIIDEINRKVGVYSLNLLNN